MFTFSTAENQKKAPLLPEEHCPLGYSLTDKQCIIKCSTEVSLSSCTTQEDVKDLTIISNNSLFNNYTTSDIIQIHNKALILLLHQNKPTEGMNLLLPLCHYWIVTSSSSSSSGSYDTIMNHGKDQKSNNNPNNFYMEDNWIHLSCQVCFLLLDCILQTYRGSYLGLPSQLCYYITNSTNSTNPIGKEDVKKNESEDKKSKKNNSKHNNNNNNNNTTTTTSSMTSSTQRKNENKPILVNIDDILSWMEAFILEEQNSNSTSSADVSSTNSTGDTSLQTSPTQNPFQNFQKQQEEYFNELKFRWHLYKARIVLLQQQQQQESSSGNNTDKTRVLKKELKSALELYHQKLRLVEGNATNTLPIEKKADTKKNKSIMTIVNTQHRNPILQNQIALYIKANYENHCCFSLQNNTNLPSNNLVVTSLNNPKRSLKLSIEARRVASEKTISVNNTKKQKELLKEEEILEDIFFYNNLGIIHLCSGKIHMSYIYYTKAVTKIFQIWNFRQANPNKSKSFKRKIPLCEVLHNASIAALQSHQYIHAYYYMAKCIQNSPNVFAKRSRCWLRLAESCINIYNTIKQRNEWSYAYNYSQKDFTPRIVGYNHNIPAPFYEDEDCVLLSPILGDEKDLQQIETGGEASLFRALFCLRCAKNLLLSNHDTECFENIHLNMAFCHLERSDFASALTAAKTILDHTTHESYFQLSKIAKRRRIIARFYVCESLCFLNRFKEAYHIFHSGIDDDTKRNNFDRYQAYIKDLSMVGKKYLVNHDNHQQQHFFTKADNINQQRLNEATIVMSLFLSGLNAFQGNMNAAILSIFKTFALTDNKIIFVEGNDQDALESNISTILTSFEATFKNNIKKNDEKYLVSTTALRNLFYCLCREKQWKLVEMVIKSLLIVDSTDQSNSLGFSH